MDCADEIGTGYGKIQLARGDLVYGRCLTVRATRVSLFLATGVWPEPGQMALHTCDNPACVNPDHLFLGNHRDNMRDMVSKQRSAGDRGTWRGGVKSPERGA